MYYTQTIGNTNLMKLENKPTLKFAHRIVMNIAFAHFV